MKHGKKYTDSAKLLETGKQYDLSEAVELVKQTAKAKFDETIELSVRLGVDPRHADQQVRGAVVLPHGTGKKVRVLVFCKADKEAEAQAAGADFIGGEEMIAKIQEGWLDFRCGRCYPGYDGPGGPRCQNFGTPRPDAEPEIRHGNPGCDQGRERNQSR